MRLRNFILALFTCLFALHVSAVTSVTSPLTLGPDLAQSDPVGWVAEGWRVANPDAQAAVVDAEGAVGFAVTRPNSAMAWTLSTEPIWTRPFGAIAISYVVDGEPAADGGPLFELFDGSTGPITPGATNSENPLASGGRHAFGELNSGLHVEVIDLSTVENLDRVAEITLTLRSGAAPVSLRLNQFAFLAAPADPVAAPQGRAVLEVLPDGAIALALPEKGQPLAEVLTAFGLPVDTLQSGSMALQDTPFQLTAEAGVTSLSTGGAIELSVGASGARLALLCAARLWGTGEGWYSAGVYTPRSHAAVAHAFRVSLHYEDGATAVAQPVSVDDATLGLAAGLEVYTVPVDPTKVLARATVIEEMSYGQFALMAATLLPENGAPATEAAPVAIASAAMPQGTVAEGDILLETPNLRLVLGRDAILRSFQVGPERRELVTTPFEFVTIMEPDGAAYPLAFASATPGAEPKRLAVAWSIDGGRGTLELDLEVRPDGGLVCTPHLTNTGADTWSPWAIAPRMTGVQLSRGGDTAYILGARSALQDSAPIDMAEVYGGHFPLQFMDSYDGTHGGGLALMVLDDTLTRKLFEFKKGDDGLTTMTTSYRNLTIAPGERRSLPSTLLLPHEGDWRGPFAEYRAWVRERFPRARPNGMADLFYCRRDYPLGGTTYLFDPATKSYSIDRLISESRWAFGGVDMIDISGWAYNEQVGRVGTYQKNDLGGLETLASGIASSQAKGVQVGLYFEGYLLDKRAERAAEGLAEWRLIREGNQPAWWGGEMEFFCCPGAKGWQEALAADVAAVASATKADAVYLDQLGICGTDKECWDARHGHPVPSNPIVEEIALIRRVREALDAVRPECAIYIEHIPADAMTPYIDGAFNMGMKHTRHALGPTKLPLHRYLHPEVPIFEMVAHGIRPMPAEEDDLKLSFFHGMGLWLKGKGASWYSDGFRRLAPAYHQVLNDYAPYFRSPDVRPQVDTLQPGLYANQFDRDGSTVYTLYNATPETISGPVLPVEGAKEGRELLDISPFGVKLDIASGQITGTIPPHGVTVVWVGR